MMDYLDYLPATPYEKLPAAVKATISAEDYAAKRSLALELGVGKAQENALPEALRSAYRKKHAASVAALPASVGAVSVVGRQKHQTAFRWMAAACICLAAVSLTLLLREPKERIIYQVASTETPAPTVIHDTIFQEKILEKVVYLTRTDTLREYLTTAPTFVYKTDTVYLPRAAEIKFVKSKTAAEEVRLLELLVPAK
jgi:hypothetical protein